MLRNDRNRGYVETFLRAASRCRGDWVAFCDQDDVWLGHKLARVAEVVARHPRLWLVSHSAEQVDADLRPLASRFPNYPALEVRGPLQNAPLGVYPGFTCCVRRAVFEPWLVEGRPVYPWGGGQRQAHDQFAYSLAGTYGHTATLPDVLALYRRHGGAVTTTAGSPVYDVSARAALKAGLGATAEGYRLQGRLALEYRRHFARILGALEGGAGPAAWVGPTRDAVAYYGRLAEALEARAALYADAAPLAARARAFARNVARRAYLAGPLGRGLGAKAMAKDLARVFVRW